jgi:hypothetical protein
MMRTPVSMKPAGCRGRWRALHELGWRFLLCGSLLVGGTLPPAALALASAPPTPPAPPPAPPPALKAWVLKTRDNEGAPFIVIDKRRARLWLFDAAGQALGDTPVLLGLARGDISVPGIGERPMNQIRPEERTTPAGRFRAEAGHNADGEDIFWIDFDAAVSMHRVRATNPAERRLQRLSTPTPDDNRISYGCINVPAPFYDQRIRPAFSRRAGVVYVLPETLPAEALFTPRQKTPGAP